MKNNRADYMFKGTNMLSGRPNTEFGPRSPTSATSYGQDASVMQRGVRTSFNRP